ncbi:RNA-DNA hybrid ribonuclease [Podochytrium sp. JEL0797]|nr:RNA-DNA hybrid ribonuclease [Podochytrium sp. JEL0797]
MQNKNRPSALRSGDTASATAPAANTLPHVLDSEVVASLVVGWLDTASVLRLSCVLRVLRGVVGAAARVAAAEAGVAVVGTRRLPRQRRNVWSFLALSDEDAKCPGYVVALLSLQTQLRCDFKVSLNGTGAVERFAELVAWRSNVEINVDDQHCDTTKRILVAIPARLNPTKIILDSLLLEDHEAIQLIKKLYPKTTTPRKINAAQSTTLPQIDQQPQVQTCPQCNAPIPARPQQHFFSNNNNKHRPFQQNQNSNLQQNNYYSHRARGSGASYRGGNRGGGNGGGGYRRHPPTIRCKVCNFILPPPPPIAIAVSPASSTPITPHHHSTPGSSWNATNPDLEFDEWGPALQEIENGSSSSSSPPPHASCLSAGSLSTASSFSSACSPTSPTTPQPTTTTIARFSLAQSTSDIVTGRWQFLETLCLMDCLLTDASLEVICERVVTVCHALCVLDLRGNEFTEAGTTILAQTLPPSNITTLNLSSTHLTDTSLLPLTTTLPLTSLTHLHLSDNKITHAAMHPFSIALSTTPHRLLHLDLANNTGIGDLGAQRIVSALWHGIPLDTIVLDKCNIGYKAVDQLGRVLGTSRVRVIKISENPRIGPPGMTRLAEGLMKGGAKQRVEEVWIGGGNAGDSGCRAILQACRDSRIRVLDLRDNQMTNEGAKVLAGVIAAEGSCLERVYIGENRIADGGVVAVASALVVSCVVELVLDGNLLDEKGEEALRRAFLEVKRERNVRISW